MNPHEVAAELDRKANIAVRSGHHCTLPLMKNIIGKAGTVQASVYFYNTKEEIETDMYRKADSPESNNRKFHKLKLVLIFEKL